MQVNFKKRNPLFLFLFILILATGCTQSKIYDKPADLIGQEQFVDVLVDVRLLESYLRDIESRGKVNKEEAKKLYVQLFTKNKITELQFNSSLAYYSVQPDIMSKINEKVVDKLVAMDSEATTQKHIKVEGEAEN